MRDAAHLAPDAPLPWAPAFGAGRCFVIAEAGVNHNGDVELAKQLVDAAADAGADAVKFQTWITERLVAPDAPLAAYQEAAVGGTSQFDMLKQLELTYADFAALKAHAGARGILFVSTPDEEESADFLDSLDLAFFKIGSAETTNVPLLRHIARKGRPLVLSTGMSDLDEVRRAVAALEAEGSREIVLLQCTSSYPAPLEDANVRAMVTLREELGYPVGFSDHTLGTAASLASVALGARVLERHLTLDRTMAGPDHSASLDPQQFAELVRAVREVELALGDGVKRVAASEESARATMRRVLVARTELAAGQTIRAEDLALLRASDGIAAAELDSVVGRTVLRGVAAGSPLPADALE
jgi:N,N'-diacetyllegionaminate synthase